MFKRCFYICIVENVKKVALIILDGWGYGRNDRSNAIVAANTPFFDEMIAQYPNSKLEASGLAVGLPEGQMGNSEVGHMNLGAGRVVYQELGRINKAVTDNEFVQNETILAAFNYAKENDKDLHLIGLVSDGGVHAHINHLKGLTTATNALGLEKVFIHAFLDGRDTDPNSGLKFITDLEHHIADTPVRLASAIGRYYAMDRDNRWERVKLAYDLMVKGEGTATDNILTSIEKSYADGVTDEFIKPIVKVDEDGQPVAVIKDGDVVICFNFRTDRGREISQALTQKEFPEYDMKPLNIEYVTMTSYDETFKNVKVVFRKDDLSKTLGEVLESAGKKQIRIAETEKYPHVTFFFSGGRETEFKDEKRLLVPSPKVATYDLQPEMSAEGIRDAIIPELEAGWPDFVCLNFANTDMVGHTGVFSAVMKAAETADACTKAVVEAGLKNGYSFIIIADHGNADYMINEDGSPNTAHTTNLVPCILIDNDVKAVKDGKLGDIAPTVLQILGVPIPAEMTGNVLV
ncbi:2,3-bisphosphoglycerate-independent phosphoglycerate mutase [Mucilaginibacter phyllosphaerae]|uniref:2,3-bisphosphoglycerate-independent phosphoglycerate mutase n=1 Tax=Mucilaginibacter phyllosphaerae TaxID=1812349 RepID=A0A4Y8AL34_9SPHI|nr:2,3-bisphosphoglycerate-independent phosphoglycerate mutase [Mucilaginibacter phyllosphaerae]TEW69149.1 2,3-bisphosphoglycerate-independent phosphoglycerate mutase [Mucilaginibacter phyllosphaerae]GGH03162.1 2,3-bisphosphoglycerate-independent phosphoglycerate mutase [Mucilaginibacter phyllosphaerae]